MGINLEIILLECRSQALDLIFTHFYIQLNNYDVILINGSVLNISVFFFKKM